MDYNWGIKERPDKSAARLVGKLPTSLRGVPKVAGARRAVHLEILLASVWRWCGLLVAPTHLEPPGSPSTRGHFLAV